MITVRAEKNKLFVHTDTCSQAEAVEEAIGTAHISKDPRIVQCKNSVFNLRRIKNLFNGQAKLSRDTETRRIVDSLKEEHNKWIEENELMHAAKTLPTARVLDGYKFSFKPYEHQKTGFHFMKACKRGAIFGDCGVGKTAIVASFLEYLVHIGEISKENPALIICPISIIYQAWIKDIEKFTKLRVISIYESSNYKTREKRIERLEIPAEVYISSFSLVSIMEKELRKRRFSFLAIDESSKIKNSQSKTFKSLIKIAWKADRKYIMSGTPAPNGPLDLWSQFFFLDDGMTLEPSLVDFRHQHYKKIAIPGRGDHVGFWVPRSGIEGKINKQVEKRSVRFRSSECLDLPERTFMTRTIEMKGQQKQVYDEMNNNLFSELDGSTITARIALSRLMKLREITGGFVIDDDRREKPFKRNPKVDELDHLLEETIGDGTTKALVWIQYRWEARALLSRYKKMYGARGLFGDISQPQKDKNIDLFLDSPKCRLLICHPKSAAHGLTLVAASYSIYYSLSYDFEEYYQSSMRINRPGQTRPTFYYFLVARDSIDETLVDCIQNKKNVQDKLIDGAIDLSGFFGIR